MSDPSTATSPFEPPLYMFNFRVSFKRETIDGKGGSLNSTDEPMCEGAFSEITGLDASMEAKVIKEGGANYGAHQRAGQVTFGTVVLKRGITLNRDLWHWWALFSGARDSAISGQPAGGAYAYRLEVTIALLGRDPSAANPGAPMRWRLERAMPTKFKTADFNARGSEIGIEELHLVHEGIVFEGS